MDISSKVVDVSSPNASGVTVAALRADKARTASTENFILTGFYNHKQNRREKVMLVLILFESL